MITKGVVLGGKEMVNSRAPSYDSISTVCSKEFITALLLCVASASNYSPKIKNINLFCSMYFNCPLAFVDCNGRLLDPGIQINWLTVCLSRVKVIPRDIVGSDFSTVGDVDSTESKAIILTYQNVDGVRKNPSKIEALEALTSNNTIACLSETNVRTDDCALFTNSNIGEKVVMVAQDRITYKNGKRVVLPSNQRKKSGFGTVVAVKNFDDFSFNRSFTDFEIISSVVSRFGLKIIVVTGYRSPSMRQSDEIDAFYDEVSRMLEVEKSKHSADAVVFVADDNSGQDSSGTPSHSELNGRNHR